MTPAVAPRPRSFAKRLSWLLLAPGATSTVLGVGVLAANDLVGRRAQADWTLLILLGPSIPLYLLLLPLLPFVTRALRRGWDPGPATIVGVTFTVAALIDLAFWLGNR